MSVDNTRTDPANTETKPKRVKKTILIFGVSSFVGSNLAEFLKNEFRVIGTYYQTRVRIPGVLTLPCDVLNKEQVQLVLFAFKPDIAIYAVGLSSLNKCAEYDELADALNTGGLINATEYCGRYKAQICYISSGFVFGGEKKSFVEMDIPDSNTLYGKTMAASEFYIQKSSLNYIIFRCCRLYGRGIQPGRINWYELMQKQLKANSAFTADGFVTTGYLDVYYLAMILKICFDKGVTNRLFQVSSVDHMTQYQFIKQYCEIFGDPEGIVSKGKLPFPATSGSMEDALYYQLDNSNLEGYLHISMPKIKESLEYTFRRLKGERSKGTKGEDIKFI